MKPHNVKHLAIIMDGNARWALNQGLTKSAGHKIGAELIKNLVPNFIELNIPYVTLYSFSSENWQRPTIEVAFLLKLLSFYLKKELSALHKNGVKIKIIGKLELLNSTLQQQITQAIELTKNNDKLTLCIAFSYGSRGEIVNACQKIINSGKKEIDENDFKNYLYDPEMPDVDLLIRTSGVLRISNFLLWQAAYAELYFSPKNWPDFTKNDIIEALEDYSMRKRSFGAR